MPHTGEVRALWILVVAGCHSADSPITLVDSGPGPLSYKLTAGWTDPPDKPTLDPKPVIYIDDVATQELVLEYPNPAAALAEEHVIELRLGDAVVFTQISNSTSRVCLSQVPDPTTYLEGWCAYANGELRFGSDQAGSSMRTCVGDGFCWPTCRPGSGCSSGSHCTSIYASTNPVATHLGCAPLGTQQIDAACTLVTDASGTHDDCGSGLLCVGGTCKRVCDRYNPPANCTCTYLAEHAPELAVCL